MDNVRTNQQFKDFTHKRLQAGYDARIQAELWVAQDLMRHQPDMLRGEALRLARKWVEAQS